MPVKKEINMGHNLPETRGRGADYEPYFPSERALTGLLPNYRTTQPVNWPLLTAPAELRQLEETANYGNNLMVQ
jgi:hypothetical protein